MMTQAKSTALVRPRWGRADTAHKLKPQSGSPPSGLSFGKMVEQTTVHTCVGSRLRRRLRLQLDRQ